MSNDLKKSLEIIGYLVIEIGLAFLLVDGINYFFPITLPKELTPIITVVFVYFGKIIVKKCKE